MLPFVRLVIDSTQNHSLAMADRLGVGGMEMETIFWKDMVDLSDDFQNTNLLRTTFCLN